MLYGRQPNFSHADAGRMERADVMSSMPLAHDYRYAQGVSGVMNGRIRSGQDDQVRAGAIAGMNGVQRMEARLRGENVVRSDGRILTEEENRQMNLAMLQRGADPRTLPGMYGPQPQPVFNPMSFYQGAPSQPMPPDPRLMEQQHNPYGPPPQFGGYSQQPYGYPQAAPAPQPQIQFAGPQQPPRLAYGDNNAAMVGDLIKCESKRGPMAQMMGEVEGATPNGVRVTFPQVGIVEVPFQDLPNYALVGRAS